MSVCMLNVTYLILRSLLPPPHLFLANEITWRHSTQLRSYEGWRRGDTRMLNKKVFAFFEFSMLFFTKQYDIYLYENIRNRRMIT
jgi:hypothetical protein